MAKPFRIIFNITDKDHDRFKDTCIWVIVKQYSTKKLIKFIFNYLDSVSNLKLKFYKLKFNTLGMYDNFDGHENISLSPSLRIDEVPAVFLHEVFHAIFPQIENDKYIIHLEKKTTKALTLQQGYKILNYIFKNTSWRSEWKKDRNRKKK